MLLLYEADEKNALTVYITSGTVCSGLTKLAVLLLIRLQWSITRKYVLRRCGHQFSYYTINNVLPNPDYH